MAIAMFPQFQWFDDNGDPLNGGLIYTYEAGSTTPKTVYQDYALSTQHANPIVLSSTGRLSAPIWVSGEVKIVVKTSAGVALDPTIDKFNADSGAGFGDYAAKNADVLTKSANYTVVSGDDGKLIVATSGTWTLDTTSAASVLGNGFEFTFMNIGTGVITFNPNGAETVNGKTSIALPPGANMQVRCDGSNWRARRGGAWDAIAYQAASTSAQIDFDATTHPTMFDGTYDTIVVVLSAVKPATDDVSLRARIGTGAGPTYATANYESGGQQMGKGGAANYGSDAALDNITTALLLSRTGAGNGVGNASGEAVWGEFRIDNPDSTDYISADWRFRMVRSDELPALAIGSGIYTASVGPVTGLRFFFSSGNIASGDFRVFGLRK